MDETVIRDVIRANDELGQALELSMEKALAKTRKTETLNRPVQLVEKAATFLESIDLNILLKMNNSELANLEKQLSKLEQTTAEIRGNLNGHMDS